MALTVERLYKNCMALYQMKLVAGGEGLGNLVSWVHIVEDEEVSGFLKGGELVFTAGIRNQVEAHWLLHFAENIHETGASAFVVNLGPHIKGLPREVADYCNEIQMPLFTIPWETRMVDVTRDFCQRIFHSENVEDTVSMAMKNLLFQIGDQETQIQQMERYGFHRSDSFCFICVTVEEMDTPFQVSLIERLEHYAEKTAKSIHDMFIHFQYQESLIMALVEYTQEQVYQFVEAYKEAIVYARFRSKIFIGVGSNIQGVENQRNNFENARMTNLMAMRKGNPVVYYEELDFYKILFQVKDVTVLQDYYQELIGKLELYDQEQGTDLLPFLEAYLDCEGSPKLVAESQHIHRNTVNNMIKKIEKVTGYNVQELDVKVKCKIGLLIRELM